MITSNDDRQVGGWYIQGEMDQQKVFAKAEFIQESDNEILWSLEMFDLHVRSTVVQVQIHQLFQDPGKAPE